MSATEMFGITREVFSEVIFMKLGMQEVEVEDQESV